MTRPATSPKDPRVVRAARLLRDEDLRREEGALVVDGEELLREAIAAGFDVEYELRGSRDAMRSLAFAGDVPDVVAVVRMSPSRDDLPPGSLVLAGVADAGNVGSIVRTAAALGVPRVALTPDCADPWSRKALRAALGASFAPGLVATGRSLEELARLDRRPPLAAAVPRGGEAPEALPPGAAVVLGSERDGLAPGDRALCDLAVTVPAEGFESLNVAAAAAILAYVNVTRRPGADDER